MLQLESMVEIYIINDSRLPYFDMELKMIKLIAMLFLFSYIGETKAQVYFANPVSASFQEQFEAFSEKEANLEKDELSPLEKYYNLMA